MSADDAILHAVFAEFASSLVPEAFETSTRAQRVDLEPVDLSGGVSDPDAGAWFTRWVDERIVDALEASWPDGCPATVVFTSDGRLLRRYDDCGCGAMSCATDPASAEARSIAAPWLLAASLPRPQPTWRTVRDAQGYVVGEEIVGPAASRWMATWYAEARGRGVAEARAGTLSMDGEEVVSAVRMGTRDTPVLRRFHRLLFRHPSRKHHPLGRGR